MEALLSLRWLNGKTLGLIIALVVAIRLCAKLAHRNTRRRISATWGRWLHWEFWPAWLFYLPVGANYLRLALKYRGFTLPN